MKRLIVLIATIALLIPAMGQSKLKNGHWVKIAVSESGIYSLSYTQLRQWGLNPEATHVYGYGGAMLSQNFQQPAIEDLPQVGCVRQGERILFYAQGSFSWSYNGSYFQHTRNPYSDKGYYLLSDCPTDEPDLIPLSAIEDEDATEVTSFIDYQVHEVDKVNLIDVMGIEGGGREWYGEELVNNKTQRFTLPFHDIIGETVRMNVMAAGMSLAAGQLTFTIGNESLTMETQKGSDSYTMADVKTFSRTVPKVGNGNQTVSVSYSSSLANGNGYLNYIAMQAECRLTMQGESMRFRTATNMGSSQPLRYHLSGAKAGTVVLDITKLDEIRQVVTTMNGNELTFVGSNEDGIHEYIALNPTAADWGEVEKVADVENQDLHSLQGIQYVIITPKAFVEQAKQLARAHEADPYWKGRESMTWAVVTDEQVYNEFSSGTPDATAYRRFMKMLYDKAKADNTLLAPRWLLLMGDGTYDNRKISKVSGENTLLTYQTVNSSVKTLAEPDDGYFGCVEEELYINEAILKMQIGVGRLPVTTVEEAQAVVDKLENYILDTNPMSWRREVLFMADNYDSYQHIECADGPAKIVEAASPAYVIDKIYLDVYPKQVSSTAERYPVAQTQLDNHLQTGVLMLNYSGHGSYTAITSEAMMNINSIRSMTNPHQALWFFATCSFAHFDAGKRSAAEEAVLNAKGGAIGVISAARTVYASQNKALNEAFCKALFRHEDDYHYDMTIGEALVQAKNAVGPDMNKLAYHLLGDPALRLHFPDEVSVHTTKNKSEIRALEIDTVEAVVGDATHDTLHSFNGMVDITVYDKKQTITATMKVGTYDYEDYPNILFHGKAQAKDGCFKYLFMVPKDIRYNFDKGRIVYYAYDETTHQEGIGYDHDLTIGGTSTAIITDTEGPEIRMYLEDSLRSENQTTYSAPRFYATLYDKNGINTVGSGIGHDLILMVDNDNAMTYNLNTYYEAEPDSYQRGSISYRLPELSDGEHELSFKAWDLLNNSSTEKLRFTVNAGTGPTLYKIYAYPNPVSLSDQLTLHLEHDQQDEVLETNITLYDYAGRRLFNRTQPNAEDVVIPMSQVAISTGIYIYKVIITSPTSGSSSLAGKVMVVH